MHAEGPPLEALTHRLSECPEEFLLPHSAGASKGDSIDVVAIVSDHLRAWGLNPPPPGVGKKLAEGEAKRQENRLRLVSIATWLLADEWFVSRAGLATAGATLLAGGLDDVAQVVEARSTVTDPDRREELTRFCLSALGLRPAGETAAQAADRLTTLNTSERLKVLRATRAAEERARQVREAMARRAAEEAAARYAPE